MKLAFKLRVIRPFAEEESHKSGIMLAGERSGLLTRTATMESVSLSVRMKSSARLLNLSVRR